MKVRIANVPYFDNAALHMIGAVVDIVGPEKFSAACMVPADKEAEQALVGAGRWPLDEAGNGPKSRGAAGAVDAGGVSLVDVAKTEATRIVDAARREAEHIVSRAKIGGEAFVEDSKRDAAAIVASARHEAERIVADAKKATETKTEKPKA